VLSVSRGYARVAALVTSLSLLAGAATGCSTTQEKAEKQKARAEHILEARKQREDAKKAKKHGKSGKDEGGSKQ
jgi:F0F1-type ATP synthase epsilon subunit